MVTSVVGEQIARNRTRDDRFLIIGLRVTDSLQKVLVFFVVVEWITGIARVLRVLHDRGSS